MKAKSQDQKSKSPTFGASSLPNSQLDACRLVGGLVENGFSGQPLNSPSAAPDQPSSLSLWLVTVPTAHFRLLLLVLMIMVVSETWMLKIMKNSKFSITLNKIVAFANPLQRKKEKDMDPSVLQVIKEEDVRRSAMSMDVEQENLRTELNEHYKEPECSSPAETSDWNGGTTSAVTIDRKEMKIMEIVLRSSELDSVVHKNLSNDIVDEHGGNSRESQIDSENCARIENMTDSELQKHNLR